MKKIRNLLVAGLCFYSIAAFSQSNNNSSGKIPVNADPASTPPPVQAVPATPQTNAPPINKVILKSQVDSMDTKKRNSPTPTQNVNRDTSRYLIYPGDTVTAPKRR